MSTKQKVDTSEFADIPSLELLMSLHIAKEEKNNGRAELIEKEFLRRDLEKVNYSILGRIENGKVEIKIQQQEHPKIRTKLTVKSDHEHCFCFEQKDMFSNKKTLVCCRCSAEKETA